MKIAIWFIAAIAAWYVGGMNLAISISKTVYHEDIRTVGSGNPGFTNFKRVYGNKYAWFIFAFDLCKGAVMCLAFGFWFRGLGYDFQLGAAYTGLFVMLGHSFPLQYRFRGGKGFLVLLSELFVLDWRVGLIAFGVMTVLLLTLKYMSLATMCGLTAGAVMLFVLGCHLPAAIIYSACVVFMIIRHKENIKRIKNGTESKFTLHHRSQKKTTKDDELFKRIITGAAITAASVIIAVYSDHVNVMKSAVSLFGIAAVAELFRAAKATQHIPLLSVMLLTAAATPFFETGIYPYLLFFVFGAAVIISLYFMLHIDKLQGFKTGQTVLISLITLTLIRSFYEITRLPNGRLFLWLTVVVCASTDIFAYLIGRQIGTHKLARKISPNKTVEGCVSGTICALLFGFLFTVIASTELEIQVHFGLLLPMILLLSCIGQFGDLSLSAVKRICSVKDFGRILPGHGGILDRIDSMLFAVPLSYILCFLGIHLFP